MFLQLSSEKNLTGAMAVHKYFIKGLLLHRLVIIIEDEMYITGVPNFSSRYRVTTGAKVGTMLRITW